MNAIQKLVDHFGGQTKTAKALGVSQAAVSCWLAGIHATDSSRLIDELPPAF